MTKKNEIRSDDYENIVTGLAGPKDKSRGGRFRRIADLKPEVLDAKYEQDALAARIVDRVVDDGTRTGFTLKGPDTSFDFASVMSDLEDLDAINTIADAWRWARLYGGALIVMNVNDGGKLEEPLNLEQATKLSSLHVIESRHVIPAAFNPGLGARAFSNPDFYDVTVPIGKGGGRKIHRSRTIRIDGVRVPPLRMIERGGWGPSVLQRVDSELTQLGEVMGYARNLMHEMSVMVLKLEGFRDQVCASKDSKENLQKVIEMIRWTLDNLHTLALDSKDDYSESARTVAGLADLIDRFVAALVRAQEMPKTVLLGEQPGGQNASADSEIRSWFDFVDSQRELKLTPILNRILKVYFATQANAPSEWTIEYPPLWQPTEKERAETGLKVAQTDAIYLLHDVTDADTVLERLISQGLIAGSGA